jgi:hypothetical protein
MHITLSPQRRDDTLTVVKTGEVLTINGDEIDFSVIPDGATLPADASPHPFICGAVHRIDGELHIPLLLPIGPSASMAQRFPDPIVNPPDGMLELPQ